MKQQTKFECGVLIKIEDLSLQQIAASGQCFRLNRIDNCSWEVNSVNKKIRVAQIDAFTYLFDCSQQEFHDYWYDYFDLATDYRHIRSKIFLLGDTFLNDAVRYGYGLRILKQDLWEMIVTFIISQRNNIPKIKNTINKICSYFGKFPSAKELYLCDKKTLCSFGLGYRAAYIHEAAEVVYLTPNCLKQMQKLSYERSLEELMKFKGIGEKVANCIALFGLHKLEAFPVDVWIQKVLDKHYPDGFDLTPFKEYAGVIQQYMYFYQRSLDGKQVYCET